MILKNNNLKTNQNWKTKHLIIRRNINAVVAVIWFFVIALNCIFVVNTVSTMLFITIVLNILCVTLFVYKVDLESQKLKKLKK